MTKKIKIDLLLYTFIVLALHAAGVAWGLYENIFEYDKVLHLFAGAWVALILLWLFKNRKVIVPDFINNKFKSYPILTLLLSVLCIGLIWEVFEFALVQYADRVYSYDMDLQPSYFDTLLDISADIIGAWFISYFYLNNKD